MSIGESMQMIIFEEWGHNKITPKLLRGPIKSSLCTKMCV